MLLAEHDEARHCSEKCLMLPGGGGRSCLLPIGPSRESFLRRRTACRCAPNPQHSLGIRWNFGDSDPEPVDVSPAEGQSDASVHICFWCTHAGLPRLAPSFPKRRQKMCILPKPSSSASKRFIYAMRDRLWWRWR